MTGRRNDESRNVAGTLLERLTLELGELPLALREWEVGIIWEVEWGWQLNLWGIQRSEAAKSTYTIRRKGETMRRSFIQLIAWGCGRIMRLFWGRSKNTAESNKRRLFRRGSRNVKSWVALSSTELSVIRSWLSSWRDLESTYMSLGEAEEATPWNL